VEAVGQAAVLGTIVSWRWWWVPVTAAGSVITQFGFATLLWLFTATIVAPVLGVAAAVPQWLLLRKYGWTSVAWLVVPLIVSPLNTAIYSTFAANGPGYIDYMNSPSRWIPIGAISGALTGLIEAIALVWILAPEFAGTMPRVAPRRPLPARTAPSEHLTSVRWCLGILMALTIPIFMPKMMMETFALPDSELVPYAIAAIVPWAVALGLLTQPGLQQVGLAISATASSLLLLPMVPIMALITLMSGYVAKGDERLMYFGALAATGVLPVLAVQSIRAARSVPDALRVDWAWPGAAIGCIGYAMLVLPRTLLIGAIRRLPAGS
jgi:hypothetical protein